MDRDGLKAVQDPLKQRYREDKASAVVTMHASGSLEGDGVTCSVDTGRAVVRAGLHPAGGGDGSSACSGDMLLQALVACAGVTLRAVATSMGVDIRSGVVHAEGDLDVRGTLGVDKQAPVGFRDIRLSFDMQTDAEPDVLATLIKLTERYCVVYQTIMHPPLMTVSHTASPAVASA
ncbi:MAG: OsmC family protein [Mycobacteriaceae bacterium]